jgi:WD40 repeat protein
MLLLSPDGNWLTTSCDGDVALFEVSTGRQVTHFRNLLIQAEAFSPDSRLLMLSDSKHILAIDTSTGKLVPNLTRWQGATAIAFDGNGHLVALGYYNTIRVLKIATGAETMHMSLRFMYRNALALSPDGQWLATGSDDNTVRIFDTKSSREIARLPHRGPIEHIAFSPNGRWVSTRSSVDETARVFEISTEIERALVHESYLYYAAAFTVDGKWVVTKENDDRTMTVLEVDLAAGMLETAKSESIILSPDGLWLAFTTKDGVMVREVAAKQETAHIIYPHKANTVTFSQDSRLLVISSDDNVVRLFDIQSDKETMHLTDHRSEQIESMFGDILKFELTHEEHLNSVAVGPDVHWVAVATDYKYRVRIEQPFANDEDRMHLEIADEILEPDIRQHALTAVEFDRNENKVAMKETEDQIVRLFAIADEKQLARLVHYSPVKTIAVSHDGRLLATATDAGTVSVFDTGRGKRLWQFNPQIDSDPVYGLGFSPDDHLLAVGTFHGAAYLFEVGTGRQTVRFSHQFSVKSVVFSPDNLLLATASDHTRAAVFEIGSRRNIAQIDTKYRIGALRFTNDVNGLDIITTGGDFTSVQRHLLHTEDLIRNACSRLTRNLTEKEWMQYLENEPYQRTCLNLP